MKKDFFVKGVTKREYVRVRESTCLVRICICFCMQSIQYTNCKHRRHRLLLCAKTVLGVTWPLLLLLLLQVDVVVSEWMGYALLFETML